MAHMAVNVYNERHIEIVEVALDAAKRDGAETNGEALALVAAAYTGHGDEIFDEIGIE